MGSGSGIGGEERLVWDSAQACFLAASAASPAQQRRFLKGPVPWSWVETAAAQPGKTLEVGLCLWRLSGATRSRTIRLGNREVERLGVNRYAKSRALAALSRAGLVRLEARRGRAPLVTLLVPDGEPAK